MQLKRVFSRWLLCLTIIFACQIGYSQITVSGTVTDVDGNEPLIGVSILIKGTGTGAITDINGSYTVSLSEPNSVLLYSYTGYGNQEIVVGSQQIINIQMSTQASAIDEVVVIGYTTRKKGELTGSVSSVSSEDLERTTNKDVVKSLAGKVPGLIISDRGGAPGATDGVSILIRGKSTLGNNAPLILIDNIPAATFSHLSPQDIESISVLKDGAAAIYGARAANGVILVTTKRGKTGAPVIKLSSAYNESSFSSTPALMTSEQYAIYRNEASERLGENLRFSEEDIAKYAAGNDPLYPSTDWGAVTFAESSPEWRHSLSVSGGSDAVKYFVSGDYIDQVGLYKSGDLNFNQSQLRSNVDINLHKRFKVGIDVSGQFGTRNAPGVDDGFIYKHIYTNEPGELSVNPDGSNAWGGENGANPIIMTTNEVGFVKRKDNNLRSRLSYNWDIGGLINGLSLRGFAGIRNWTTNTKTWYTPWTVYKNLGGTSDYIPQLGFSQQGTENSLRERFWQFNELMLNSTIHYEKNIGNHSFNSFVGSERFTSNQREFWAERRGFPSSNVPELFAGSDEGQISDGGSAEWARLNYFGSISYDYKKRYFVDLTLRHDGSSNFGPGNRFGTFPGIGVGWSLADERFMDATNGWLDALKIRTSYAIMGNDRIAAFQWQTQYNFGGDTDTAFPNYYVFGTNGIRYNGFASSTTPNPDITWETATMTNLGLSFGMLDYKFTGDLNYFFQRREDILVTRNASIPDAAGLELPQENLGIVNNFGWEAQLGWQDKIGDISYNLGANLTNARNEVVYIDEAVDVAEGLKREGFPLDSYIIYPTDGIFKDQADVESTDAVRDGTVEGEPKYIDSNGDGVIDAGDRVRIYSSNVPEFQYGVLGGFGYKNFDINFLFQGQAGAEMIVFFDQSGALPSHVFTDRWTPDNRDARYPRAFNQGDAYSGNQNTAGNFQAADTWLHDASFLRLKEVEVGYRITKSQAKFGDARIFFRGLNLLTMFSEVYKLGLDPEAARYDNFRNSTIPSLKSYSVGVNFTFN